MKKFDKYLNNLIIVELAYHIRYVYMFFFILISSLIDFE
jgi:hypothetical protein